MSALDLAQISACLASLSRPKPLRLTHLPVSVLANILCYCDGPSRQAAAMASRRLASAVAELADQEQQEERDSNDNPALRLDQLPEDVLLAICKFLPRHSLASVAQTCSRLRALAYSDCLWVEAAREALASSQLDPGARARSQEQMGAREKVMLGCAWTKGEAREGVVAVQSSRFMPRLQLERQRLWVSWGSKIWCHPRLPGGGVAKTTSRVLRGHSDDVSKFVVDAGMVVSGGRDRSLCGWSANSGGFLFARRYCHGGEVTAVDVTAQGSVIVTGSRDSTVLVWGLQHDTEREGGLLPVPVRRHGIGDRVWSVAVSPQDSAVLAVGTAATRGVAPLRLYDLVSGAHLADLGTRLKNGAGMLDTSWLSPTTLLSCGYDTFTRLWDTRVGGAVLAWEEQYDESVYCLATDRVNCLVTGTSRYGRFRVWDMRSSKGSLYMRHAAPARRGQSSPVYSLAMDASNLYVSLDQSLNHFGFGAMKGEEKGRSCRREDRLSNRQYREVSYRERNSRNNANVARS